MYFIFFTGAIAQLVEHRTENPGVPGSIPGGTTTQKDPAKAGSFILRAIRRKLAFKIEAIKMKPNSLGFFLGAKDRTIGITEFR